MFSLNRMDCKLIHVQHPAVAHVYMGRRRRRRCPIVYLRGEISAEALTPPDRHLFNIPDRGHVQNSHQQRAYL